MRNNGRVACILDPLFDANELQMVIRALRAERWRPEIVGPEVRHALDDTKAAVGGTDPADFTGLFIAGCDSPPCLAINEASIGFVQRFDAMKRTIAATAAGTDLLIAAGLVAGRTVTAPESMVDALRAAGADVVTDPVVVDKNWITSRGAADAEFLADTFVERLNEAGGIVSRQMPSHG